MNKLIGITLLWLVVESVSAQTSLSGTAWHGLAHVPGVAPITMHFKADSLSILLGPGLMPIETMVYTVKSDTLILRKTGGGSPCDTESLATLLFSIKNDEMTLTPLTDTCNARQKGWSNEPYRKVPVPTK